LRFYHHLQFNSNKEAHILYLKKMQWMERGRISAKWLIMPMTVQGEIVYSPKTKSLWTYD